MPTAVHCQNSWKTTGWSHGIVSMKCIVKDLISWRQTGVWGTTFLTQRPLRQFLKPGLRHFFRIRHILYTLPRSVSHKYLKNTLYHIASENKSIRLEVYQIILAFYSQFCQPKKSISKHIVYFTLPFVHKLQEDVNLNSILNCKAAKSHLPLPAKKFKIYISYKYGPTIGQSIFNYNKVLSSLPLYKEGDLLTCDCNDKFSKFVYKPHGHVHTGNLELIENVPLRNIMKWELNLEKRHPVRKINWPIYTEMLLNSSQKSSSIY